jgi:hypothetical protein
MSMLWNMCLYKKIIVLFVPVGVAFPTMDLNEIPETSQSW